jgi:LysR family transcriptional activator of nhaA
MSVVSYREVLPRTFSHKLGDSGTTFFGVKSFAVLSKKFPQSLDGQPFLMTATGTASRSDLDGWLASKGVRPRVVGEFDDTALMKVFGDRGRGLFAAPSAIEEALLSTQVLEVIGRADEVRQSYYAITIERRLRHPAVMAIADRARKELFG